MDKEKCLKWAEALINGTHKKATAKMSNAANINQVPTAMCCLGVANEVFKVKGYEQDRTFGWPYALKREGVLKSEKPEIYNKSFANLNDKDEEDGWNEEKDEYEYGDGMTHEQIGLLLLFAIESGEYKNI